LARRVGSWLAQQLLVQPKLEYRKGTCGRPTDGEQERKEQNPAEEGESLKVLVCGAGKANFYRERGGAETQGMESYEGHYRLQNLSNSTDNLIQ